MEKIKKFIVPVIIVIVLLGIAAGLYYLKGNTISKDKASTIAIDFINTNLSQGQATATVKEITSQSGVYRVKIDVQGQEYSAYITKDGKILFPQGAEITPTIADTVDNGNSTADIPKAEKSAAMLFVMSFCPYGNQAEDAMLPVVNLLKDKADVQLHYVIYSNYNGGGPNYCLDAENKYCSMHGIQELNQGVRELCVQKYQPDKLWGFVSQVNVACTAQDADTCWQEVATKAGVDVNKIKTCQANEATTLLAGELALNEKYGVQGSPMLLINEKEFTGARSAEGYKSGICAGFTTEPAECSQSLSSTTNAADGSCE
ncbi:MAG: hypothetical protein V1686_00870 [Patescibacteria group bacterium]